MFQLRGVQVKRREEVCLRGLGAMIRWAELVRSCPCPHIECVQATVNFSYSWALDPPELRKIENRIDFVWKYGQKILRISSRIMELIFFNRQCDDAVIWLRPRRMNEISTVYYALTRVKTMTSESLLIIQLFIFSKAERFFANQDPSVSSTDYLTENFRRQANMVTTKHLSNDFRMGFELPCIQIKIKR